MCASNKLNKDGRLIRADYVLAKPRLPGALEHNRSYQDASPSIHFLARVLMADDARAYDAAILMTLQVKPSLEVGSSV
jgi:hypothetical protein